MSGGRGKNGANGQVTERYVMELRINRGACLARNSWHCYCNRCRAYVGHRGIGCSSSYRNSYREWRLASYRLCVIVLACRSSLTVARVSAAYDRSMARNHTGGIHCLLRLYRIRRYGQRSGGRQRAAPQHAAGHIPHGSLLDFAVYDRGKCSCTYGSIGGVGVTWRTAHRLSTKSPRCGVNTRVTSETEKRHQRRCWSRYF